MDAVTELVRSILQKESLNDCSVEELQAIAGQYSYFTPVQFLLAEKLKSTDENLYKEQIQKLSLYFNNPLWLDHLLNGYESKDDVLKPEAKRPESIKEEIVISNPEIFPSEENLLEQDQANQSLIEETSITAPEILDQPRQEIIESPNVDPDKENTVQRNFESQEELVDDEESTDEPSENDKSEEELFISMPPLPDLHQPPTETELSFQPYHTVDYFASQGIKYVAEEKPADHFTKQLKSFTEWLKTMKRLPQMETPKTDVVSEQKVQQLAEHSIDEDEIVTETMAEVWIKQGNKEKAIETYNKLSLLNPDKSAYFASLAEQVKNS